MSCSEEFWSKRDAELTAAIEALLDDSVKPGNSDSAANTPVADPHRQHRLRYSWASSPHTEYPTFFPLLRRQSSRYSARQLSPGLPSPPALTDDDDGGDDDDDGDSGYGSNGSRRGSSRSRDDGGRPRSWTPRILLHSATWGRDDEGAVDSGPSTGGSGSSSGHSRSSSQSSPGLPATLSVPAARPKIVINTTVVAEDGGSTVDSFPITKSRPSTAAGHRRSWSAASKAGSWSASKADFIENYYYTIPFFDTDAINVNARATSPRNSVCGDMGSSLTDALKRKQTVRRKSTSDGAERHQQQQQQQQSAAVPQRRGAVQRKYHEPVVRGPHPEAHIHPALRRKYSWEQGLGYE